MEETKVLHINSNLSVVVVRKDIKNMHLAVYPPTGRVRIAVPLSVNDEAVKLFAISKIAWIRKHQRNFVTQDRMPPRQYKQRESHYFQGRRYLLRIFEHDYPPKVELKTKTYIDLYVRPNSTIEQRETIISEWYRSELKNLIQPIIDKWSLKMGIQILDWQVKQMKTRWGTCNIDKKRIWLNLELAKKPVNCLEYIIVHEMIHMLERCHNDTFRNYLDTFLPHWEKLRDELNQLPASHASWEY
ncbi:MAG: SprT family zinc-dependent metalloprotease [Bacteroidales bacterium]|nr:SprT family zinc-dependent metalloprotease [Bacteroidales bacterium]